MNEEKHTRRAPVGCGGRGRDREREMVERICDIKRKRWRKEEDMER